MAGWLNCSIGTLLLSDQRHAASKAVLLLAVGIFVSFEKINALGEEGARACRQAVHFVVETRTLSQQRAGTTRNVMMRAIWIGRPLTA